MHILEKWLLPPKCVLTGLPAEQFDLSPVLYEALKRPEEVCPICCEPSLKEAGQLGVCGVCITSPPAFCRTQAVFYFEGVMSQLVYGLKYYQKLAYARLLAEMSYQYFDITGVQALVPVPLHPLRRRDRGYNQAELLAKELGRLLSIPVIIEGVERIKDTPSQTHLTAKQRRKNLVNAFEVKKEVFEPFSHVALVDDVITTGATMQLLASCLQRKSSLKQIQAWAIAKTQ